MAVSRNNKYPLQANDRENGRNKICCHIILVHLYLRVLQTAPFVFFRFSHLFQNKRCRPNRYFGISFRLSQCLSLWLCIYLERNFCSHILCRFRFPCLLHPLSHNCRMGPPKIIFTFLVYLAHSFILYRFCSTYFSMVYSIELGSLLTCWFCSASIMFYHIMSLQMVVK